MHNACGTMWELPYPFVIGQWCYEHHLGIQFDGMAQSIHGAMFFILQYNNIMFICVLYCDRMLPGILFLKWCVWKLGITLRNGSWSINPMCCSMRLARWRHLQFHDKASWRPPLCAHNSCNMIGTLCPLIVRWVCSPNLGFVIHLSKVGYIFLQANQHVCDKDCIGMYSCETHNTIFCFI